MPTPDHAAPLAKGFEAADWLVLGGYFALLAVTGVWLSRRKQRNTDDYFLAGRTMPAWAVAISVLATAQSAATFIGAPQSAYVSDLTYLSANIGQFLAALVVAFFFIPALYRCGATTVYELLETRVGRPSRAAAGWVFIVGRVFASGARLYVGALAGAMILYNDSEPWQMRNAIVVMTTVGIFYTFVGGIRSVIWTDVMQAAVYVGAAAAALWVLWSRIPGGAGPILAALQEGAGASKLRVLDAGFGGVGPSHTYTLWTALLGFTLLNLGFYGTDQDAMQRMLTCRSARRGAWSMIAAILVGVPVTLLFMLVGLLLWVFYQRPDLMGDAAPSNAPCGSLKVFLHFMLHDLPPGVSGFMMAGLFAAGLSSLNSALSALGSSFVNDFYRKWVRGGSDRHMLWAGRSAVVASGCLVGSFAVFCVHWQQHDQVPLVDFALRVMVFAYAGLVAVFLTVLFTNRGSNVTVIAALAVGFGLVVLMQPVVWKTDCYLLSWAARRVDAALADVVEVAAGWRFVYPTAVADVTEAVARWRLAFPWQLTFATGIAVLVCATGRRPEKRGEQHGR